MEQQQRQPSLDDLSDGEGFKVESKTFSLILVIRPPLVRVSREARNATRRFAVEQNIVVAGQDESIARAYDLERDLLYVDRYEKWTLVEDSVEWVERSTWISNRREGGLLPDGVRNAVLQVSVGICGGDRDGIYQALAGIDEGGGSRSLWVQKAGWVSGS
ncbi:hypothetical protein K461DRAFT_271992 [Myriangium duriaei CBS 260.36]|uniref:Uncharacterized protein n=1 Tax=Myriangium duriaei CBS 260.36 TaxID=1168546 RepID=A0A9P4IU91_9PEZI|nr:hypothetical protein K461DRAFT_271992 [Myriangium duriaei CBS 260.36]